MSKQGRILIISLAFAPSSRVGGKRFTFLSKLLQKDFPNLHVLTVKEKNYDSTDDSLSPGGVIHRTSMYPPYPIRKKNIFTKILNRLWCDYLCFIDPHSGWIFPALIRGLKVIKAHRINIIIATGPPFSTLVIGWLLSIITRTKLILDYRDPWTNLWGLRRKVLIKNINNMLERLVIRQASAIVFCTQRMKDNFVTDLKRYTDADLYVIYNAYENKALIQPQYLSKDKITMIYAGEFYDQRKISLLTEPIYRLMKEGVITKDNFCFHIFGKIKKKDKVEIDRYNLQDIIIEHSLVPHQQLVRYLKGADILVLIISKVMSYSVSYKFYDYLSVKKPILAIVPENSEMENVINDVDCGRTVLINSPENIYKNLRAMLTENGKYTYSGAEQFTWDVSGSKYSQIIRSLSN